MRTHSTLLIPRLIRAALRSHCRYRVAAAGLDSRGNIISLAVNTPRLETRGWHAEELLMHRSPRSLKRILLLRVSSTGILLPIDPCSHCAKLASKRGVEIERVEKAFRELNRRYQE